MGIRSIRAEIAALVFGAWSDPVSRGTLDETDDDDRDRASYRNTASRT